jgi:hypothetical protein
VISVATAPPITLANFDKLERARTLAPGEGCLDYTDHHALVVADDPRGGKAKWRSSLPTATDNGRQSAFLPVHNGATGAIAVFWFAARRSRVRYSLRGYQLDGDDVMRFNDGPNNLSPSVRVLFSSRDALDMPQGWVHEPDIWLYVNNSGCYAIDILGASGYRDRLIIKVVRYVTT